MITRLHPLNVGIEESVIEKMVIKLAPNPGSDRLEVCTSAPTCGTVSLSDAQGRAVLIAAAQGTGVSLDTSHLPAGHYIVSLHATGHEPVHAQWIKQ